jgi:hypothetical protein
MRSATALDKLKVHQALANLLRIGGDLRLTDRVGPGATFVLHLPVHDREPSARVGQTH